MEYCNRTMHLPTSSTRSPVHGLYIYKACCSYHCIINCIQVLVQGGGVEGGTVPQNIR